MIGHAWAVSLLKQHLAKAQVRHAYLFTGPEGVGKATLALRYAQALNCQQPASPGEPCGTCRACRLIPALSHPDLHLVTAEAVGGTLKVDQIRQLQRQLALSPYESRWRIALLLRFHEANASAANALLKTLEEPAPQVVLLLTARSPESLLPTIVSRCESIPLRSVPVAEVEAALMARGETAERARLLARLASGRPGQALSLAAHPEQIERRAEYIAGLLDLLPITRRARFRFVDQFVRRHGKRKKDPSALRRETSALLQAWLGIWRDVMLASYQVPAEPSNPDVATEVVNLAQTLPPGSATRALQATLRALEALDANANPRLTMEALMLDLPHT